MRGIGPTGRERDYENVTLEELQMHETFIRNAADEEFWVYLDMPTSGSWAKCWACKGKNSARKKNEKR